MFTVDMDERMTLDISFTGTAIDLVQFTCIYGDLGTAISISGITAAIDVTGNGDL